MSIEKIRDLIPDYGRDIRLNFETVLTPEGAPGLSRIQIGCIALACAYSVGSRELIQALEAAFSGELGPEAVEASKAAATIMAMNNIYYRTIHLAEDKEFSKLPAKLRMNVIGKPGVPKVDFELMSLAVSAISGCGMCINAHIHELKKAGIGNDGVQSTVRIAAVVNAAKQALLIRG